MSHTLDAEFESDDAEEPDTVPAEGIAGPPGFHLDGLVRTVFPNLNLGDDGLPPIRYRKFSKGSELFLFPLGEFLAHCSNAHKTTNNGIYQTPARPFLAVIRSPQAESPDSRVLEVDKAEATVLGSLDVEGRMDTNSTADAAAKAVAAGTQDWAEWVNPQSWQDAFSSVVKRLVQRYPLQLSGVNLVQPNGVIQLPDLFSPQTAAAPKPSRTKPDATSIADTDRARGRTAEAVNKLLAEKGAVPTSSIRILGLSASAATDYLERIAQASGQLFRRSLPFGYYLRPAGLTAEEGRIHEIRARIGLDSLYAEDLVANKLAVPAGPEKVIGRIIREYISSRGAENFWPKQGPANYRLFRPVTAADEVGPRPYFFDKASEGVVVPVAKHRYIDESLFSQAGGQGSLDPQITIHNLIVTELGWPEELHLEKIAIAPGYSPGGDYEHRARYMAGLVADNKLVGDNSDWLGEQEIKIYNTTNLRSSNGGRLVSGTEAIVAVRDFRSKITAALDLPPLLRIVIEELARTNTTAVSLEEMQQIIIKYKSFTKKKQDNLTDDISNQVALFIARLNAVGLQLQTDGADASKLNFQFARAKLTEV